MQYLRISLHSNGEMGNFKLMQPWKWHVQINLVLQYILKYEKPS